MTVKTPAQRKAEAAQAYYYHDGLIRYEIDDCVTKNKNGIDCFQAYNIEDYDDTHLIAFCDIPQEAYFLKLTRID